MSEVKFTPAPWRHVGFGALYLIKGDETPDIAVVQPRSANTERALANARLIAAAPELYEALCAALLDLNRLDSEMQAEVESAGGKYSGLRSLRMAEAALAKVDGER